jgi:formylglycine-generating enzyme required for sulfatase activity
VTPGEPVTGETTLAILLGGSAWPKSPQLAASTAFACSAQDFKQYLTDDRGFHLPATNILDLFDSPKTSPEIVEEVQNYLKQRIQNRPAPRDVFIYYTGHGGFINGRDYFLAVRSTIEGLEGTSSIRVCDLASALRNSARDLRRFLILDCCFAAAAFKEFQSTPGGAARLQTLEAFPRRGTTLLCSSSSRSVSIAPAGERNTMFSGALLDVLRNGDAAIDSPLSLEDVGLKVSDLIRDRYDDRAVRPEIHSPDQREEDIARMPLFPNPGRRTAERRPPPPAPPAETGHPRDTRLEPDGAGRRRLIQGALAVLLLLAIFGVMTLILSRPKPSAANGSVLAKREPILPTPANTTRPENPPPTSSVPANPNTVVPAARGNNAAARPPSAEKPAAVPAAPIASAPVTSPSVLRPGTASSVTVNGQTLRLVSLPAGEFRMGCSSGDAECDDDEKPVRRVSVDAFQIGATEVTQELWQAVMAKNPSDFKGAGRPVEHISWQDAQEFMDTLNQRRDGFSYRLPTEVEWEYAARAGGSAQPALSAIAWFGLAESSGRSSRPQAVATRAANGWGLYDMLGNVAEWCEDWYSPNYQRVVRGGSWVDGAKSLRVSARGKAMPGTKDYSIGLRIVRTATP